jgi:hypothetical protein
MLQTKVLHELSKEKRNVSLMSGCSQACKTALPDLGSQQCFPESKFPLSKPQTEIGIEPETNSGVARRAGWVSQSSRSCGKGRYHPPTHHLEKALGWRERAFQSKHRQDERANKQEIYGVILLLKE